MKFPLINREQISNLVCANNYSEKIVKYCKEIAEEKDDENSSSDVFPWTKHLNKEEKLEFRNELVDAFTEIVNNNDWLNKDINWSNIDEIIDSWEATAEALTNPKFMEVVNTPSAHRKYIEIE